MFKKLGLPLLTLTAAVGLFQPSVASAQDRFATHDYDGRRYTNNSYLSRGDRDNREHLQQDRREHARQDHQQDRWARSSNHDRHDNRDHGKTPIRREGYR